MYQQRFDNMQQFISYIRVSTRRQGESGLGLEAQQEAVQRYISGKGELMHEYREVASTRRKRRPQLMKALEHCKRDKAVLVVAKLDRLARNVAFLSALMESKVEFVCCDNPHATRFTIHILAAVAEFEREQISKRTKDALAAAKRRGVRLGKSMKGKSGLRARQIKRADDFALKMKPIIDELKGEGFKTLMAISEELNRRNVPTFWRGKDAATGKERWHIPTVHRLVKRIEALEATC